MKTLITTLVLFISFQIQAQTVRTQDNVNYAVVVKSGASVLDCAAQIQTISKSQGNGKVRVIGKNIGIIFANLTTYGARLVGQLSCVEAIEVDGVVHALPRIGRGN